MLNIDDDSVAADEGDVQRNESVSHPERLDLRGWKNEEHALILRQAFTIHQAAHSLVVVLRGFNEQGHSGDSDALQAAITLRDGAGCIDLRLGVIFAMGLFSAARGCQNQARDESSEDGIRKSSSGKSVDCFSTTAAKRVKGCAFFHFFQSEDEKRNSILSSR